MSEKEQNASGSDLVSGPHVPTPQQNPTDPRIEEEGRASSFSTIAARLVWRVGKRLIAALLQHPVGESVIAAVPKQGKGGRPTGSTRADDRNLTLESEKNLFSRSRWGTLLSCLLFLAAFCGGVGFLFVYWTGGSNEKLGETLAVFFAGLAAGLVVNAQLLLVHREATEQREDMQPPPEVREGFTEDWRRGALDLKRRGLLKWTAALGLGTIAVMFVSLLRSLLPDPDSTLYSGVWKRGQRLMSADGKPVMAETLAPGSTTIVFPEDSIGSEKAQTVLVRVNPKFLQLPSGRADWAPMGNLAYSRVCTHAGCPVGMYEKTAHLLMCPCHQSTFDVLRAAEPTSGPAARSLPQLPLYVDADGVLCAGGGFSEPPGPGFWGMPS